MKVREIVIGVAISHSLGLVNVTFDSQHMTGKFKTLSKKNYKEFQELVFSPLFFPARRKAGTAVSNLIFILKSIRQDTQNILKAISECRIRGRTPVVTLPSLQQVVTAGRSRAGGEGRRRGERQPAHINYILNTAVKKRQKYQISSEKNCLRIQMLLNRDHR